MKKLVLFAFGLILVGSIAAIGACVDANTRPRYRELPEQAPPANKTQVLETFVTPLGVYCEIVQLDSSPGRIALCFRAYDTLSVSVVP